MTLIPQYAKTTDAEVLAVIARNAEGAAEWNERCREFVLRHGDDPEGNYYFWHHNGSRALTGVISKAEPADGRWKRGRKAGTWEPFKNNPIRAEFDALRFRGESIPGLDDGGYLTGYRDGAFIMHNPMVFAYDGVAYMGLGAHPLADQSGGWGKGKFDGDLWTEILASEWYAAQEAATGKSVQP